MLEPDVVGGDSMVDAVLLGDEHEKTFNWHGRLSDVMWKKPLVKHWSPGMRFS